MIDASSLRQALATLEVGLRALDGAPEDQLVRDACIKRFEYSYELSHKMLRRFLQTTEPGGVEQLSFPSMIRLGFARGLLARSWDMWSRFREARNQTSHTYDEAKAKDVVGLLPLFLAEGSHLCAEIARRQAE